MKTRPYRPANGTEGEIFGDAWCSRCARDAHWRETQEDGTGCEILTRTFIYDSGDPDYPAEWIEDDIPYLSETGEDQDINPRCIAFLPEGADLELDAVRTDPRQMALAL